MAMATSAPMMPTAPLIPMSTEPKKSPMPSAARMTRGVGDALNSCTSGSNVGGEDRRDILGGDAFLLAARRRYARVLQQVSKVFPVVAIGLSYPCSSCGVRSRTHG